MDPLDKLIAQDELLGADTDAQGDSQTHADDGLKLLHRVRVHWSTWPADDPTLELSQEGRLELDWAETGTPPRRLGRFQIKREIGRGGFGIVLLAHDPKLQQDVALKIPRAETMLSPEAQARMAREARAATILAHPGIVPVYEVGEIGTVPYICGAYCPGETLADWLTAHRTSLTPRLAAQIVVSLAEAVQHAHSRGVIHRDLKPSNVLLDRQTSSRVTEGSTVDSPGDSGDSPPSHATDPSPVGTDAAQAPRGRRGPAGGEVRVAADGTCCERLRIADFGLAKVDPAKSDISQTGVPLGTPAYMSPEQARGDVTIGPATDIFALGVVLYELLAGDTPFRRKTQVATLRAIESDPHAPLPARGTPKDLVAICDKCLEKLPEDRYPTAQALQDDLHRYLTLQPVVARPLGWPTRLTRWCQRNPAIAGSLCVVFFVLGLSTVVSTTFWKREIAARSLAETAEQKAKTNELIAIEAAEEARQQARAVQNIVNELLMQLTRVPSADVQSLGPMLRHLLGTYHEHLRSGDSSDPEIQAQFVKTLEHLATIYRSLGEHEQAITLWREAIDYLKRHREDDAGWRAYYMALLSSELKAVGQEEEAIETARQALAMQRQALVSGIGHYCSRRLLIGQLATLSELLARDEPQEADGLIDEAIQLASESLGTAPAEWPATRFWNAILTDKVKSSAFGDDLGQAEQYADIAIEHVIETLDTDRTYALHMLRSIRSFLGHAYQQHNQLEAAEASYQAALEDTLELTARHPELGVLQVLLPESKLNVAEVLLLQSRSQAARELLDDALVDIQAGRARFPGANLDWDRCHAETERLLEIAGKDPASIR